MNYKLIGFKFF